MSANEIELYRIFKGPLGESDAQAATDAINNIVKNEFERNKEMLATKHDIFSVKQEIADVRLEISDVRHEVAVAKSDILKYMFAQTAVIIGLVVALMKLL